MPRSSRGSAGVGKEKKTMETIRNLIVTEEGGLTGAGYAVFIILGIAALLVGAYIAGRSSTRKKMTARELAFCAVAIALAYAASFVPLFRMPFGGSVTLFSMLFIVLIAYWYGPQTGILVGFAYGVLQFLQEPYYLSLLQVCLDYLVAFAALGVAGFFRKQKNGLIKGYLAAVFACNFTNHCCTLADDVLREAGLDFSVMLPLVDETIAKLHELPPAQAQTGPAIRRDDNVMGVQMAMLADKPEMQKIYTLLSKSIQRYD